MEIKYDNNNTFVHYNEAQGVYLNRKEIMKNKDKIYTYLGTNILYLIYTIAFTFVYFILDIHNKIIMLSLILFYGITIFNFIVFIIGYSQYKKNSKDGTIIFDEESITDISSRGLKVGFTWDKLEFVIMKDHTITFIFDKIPVIVFLDISKKEEVKRALKKYNKDNLIIES